jgi:hypothetical protein
MSKYGNWTRGEDEALLNILGGEEVVRGILRGDLKVVVKQPDLLRRITTVQVSDVKKFVAKDHLQEANVGWTSDNFKKLFLDMVEENVPEAVIAIHRLEKNSLDPPVLTELGERAKSQLAHFFGLLKKQSQGQEGILLVNGCANIAYIIGNDGNFWAVYAYWHSGNRCWYLDARSVGHPHEWSAGRQILSCDS